MTRLVSTNTELATLRTLCSRNRRLAGTLLTKIDATYFYNDESVAAYNRIHQIISRTGSPPSWNEIREDPSLDEKVREFIGEADSRLRTEKEVASAVRVLEKYRKLRGLLSIGDDVLEKLQRGKVDTDDLIDRISESVAKLRVSRSVEDLALHIGKGNNSLSLVKDILYGKRKGFIPTGFKDYDIKNGGFFWKSLITIGGTSGGGKCLVGDTLIDTELGRIPISKIWDIGVNSEPYFLDGEKVGDVKDITLEVTTYEGVAIATKVFKTRGKTIKIDFEDRSSIEGLPEHRVMVKTKTESGEDIYDWKELQDLTEEDNVLSYAESLQLGPEVLRTNR